MPPKRRIKSKPKKRHFAVKACAPAGFNDRTDAVDAAIAGDHSDSISAADTPRQSAKGLLETAYRFLTIANDLTDESDTLSEFVDAIKSVSLCKAVGIRMEDSDGWLVYGAHDGFCQGFMEAEARISLNQDPCLCARVFHPRLKQTPFFTSGGSFVVNDAADLQTQSDLRQLGPLRGTCFGLGYQSMGLFPIRSQHQIIGIIHVADPRPHRLPLDVAQLLEKVALLLGTSLEKARAQHALQLSHEDLEGKISRRTSELEAANRELQNEVGQRSQAEDRLKQSEGMLQMVFNGISDPLILVDHKVQVRIINQAAYAYYGTESPHQVVNKPCYEGLGRFREPCQTCPIPQAVKAGRHLEFERQGFIDQGRTEHVVVYPLEDDRSRPRGAVLRIQDITEAVAIKQQLDQIKSQASLGMLVSSVAHEIKNPNSFIAFNTSVLKDYLNDILPILDRHAESRRQLEIGNMPYGEFRDDVLKLVDTIEHGTRRIDGFLANLSAYRTSKTDIMRQQVALSSIIDKAMAMVGKKIQQAVNTFEIEVAQDLPDIYCDELVLEQVLINLLVNAAQAVDKGDSWIRLKVLPFESDHEYIVILVEDNGCGMDESTQRQIFEPFYSTKVLEGGTGLGLYVCRNLIREIGGTLSVTSALGKGASFTLELPIQETFRPLQSQPGGGQV